MTPTLSQARISATFAGLWLSPPPWPAGPLALLLGFGTCLFHNTLQTHAAQMVPAFRGSAVALFSCCLFGGQAIGVSIAGYTFDRMGYTPVLLVPALALPLPRTGGGSHVASGCA
ncbi:MAG: hypothetical protein V4614_12900 [Pseudomonadota bacterium]